MMNRLHNEEEIKDLIIEQVAIQSTTTLGNWPMIASTAEIGVYAEIAGRDLVVAMRCLLLQGVKGNPGYIRVPATWWEHLKEAHFTEWMKERWPVRYSSISYIQKYVCPHSTVKWPDAAHIRFMQEGPRNA